MIRSLWFKLSLAFTAMSIVSMALLGLITSAYLDYREFKRTVTPENVAAAVSSNHMFFAQAIAHPEARQWLVTAKKGMIDGVLNMTSVNGEFTIGTASDPKMYYRVYDNAGGLFFQYPETFPKDVVETFFRREGGERDGTDEAVTLREPGAIWIRQALADSDGGQQGHVEVLLIAEVDVWKLIREVFEIDEEEWRAFVVVFSLVGLMSGITANLFVTRRLKIMNKVASAWSGGEFALRIPVGDKSSDIFAEHSRILNSMASELETLVDLRQKTAVAEERNRVARELHDTVKQNLFALKLQLGAAKHKICDSSAEAHIEEAQRITREAQQDILGMLTQLNAPASGEKGFYGGLAGLSEDMTRRYGVDVVWKRKESLSPGPAEEQALLRIVQEAMNNSVRHGRATTISLDAYTEDGMRHLHVLDNGGGFPDGIVNGRRSGMGLAFMRERVSDLPGGEFSIGKSETGGAAVRIVWRAT